MQNKPHNPIIRNLTRISRESSKSFEDFFDWNQYKKDDGQYYMPPELLSIYGSELYEKLTEKQLRELTRIEAIQTLYLYAYAESVMCYYMARHLVKSDFWSEEHAFILREQIEEYRHQDMFLRALEILGKDYKPMSKFTKWWTGFEAIVLPPKIFFLLQIAIELVTREIWRLTFPDERIHPLVRDLCMIHEREEARHVTFSNAYIENAYKRDGFFMRTIAGICIALDIAFLHHFYVYPWMYKKAWISEDLKYYKTAKKFILRSEVKNMMTGSAREFLSKHWWITWANEWLFRLLTGITKNKIYGPNS